MSGAYRCEHCGETLSSPSKNYECPVKAPLTGRRRRSGLSEVEILRIRSEEFARASLSEIAEVFNITKLYACITRACGSRT